MTQREFFTAVIEKVEDVELKAYATDAIAKLDARNAKRASKPSKTQIANVEIIEAIKNVLTDTPMRAVEIGVAVGISTAKASALAPKVEGVKVVDLKVKNKGTQKGYFL